MSDPVDTSAEAVERLIHQLVYGGMLRSATALAMRDERAAATFKALAAQRDAFFDRGVALAAERDTAIAERDRLREAADTLARVAALAMFLIDKHGIANGSWRAGFKRDMQKASDLLGKPLPWAETAQPEKETGNE